MNRVVVDVSPVPTQSRRHHQVPDAVSRRIASKDLGRMGHSIGTFLNIDNQYHGNSDIPLRRWPTSLGVVFGLFFLAARAKSFTIPL